MNLTNPMEMTYEDLKNLHSDPEFLKKLEEDKIDVNLHFDSRIQLISIIKLVFSGTLEALSEAKDEGIEMGALNILRVFLETVPEDILDDFYEEIEIPRFAVEMMINIGQIKQTEQFLKIMGIDLDDIDSDDFDLDELEEMLSFE